jgi:hypothetical protein
MQFSWAFFWGTLLAGLTSVTVSLIATIKYNRWAELRRLRMDCFRQLCRYSASDEEYFRAFNEVPTLFHDRPKVLLAHKHVTESGKLFGKEMGDFFVEIASEMEMNSGDRRQMLGRFTRRVTCSPETPPILS